MTRVLPNAHTGVGFDCLHCWKKSNNHALINSYKFQDQDGENTSCFYIFYKLPGRKMVSKKFPNIFSWRFQQSFQMSGFMNPSWKNFTDQVVDKFWKSNFFGEEIWDQLFRSCFRGENWRRYVSAGAVKLKTQYLMEWICNMTCCVFSNFNKSDAQVNPIIWVDKVSVYQCGCDKVTWGCTKKSLRRCWY